MSLSDISIYFGSNKLAISRNDIAITSESWRRVDWAYDQDLDGYYLSTDGPNRVFCVYLPNDTTALSLITIRIPYVQKSPFNFGY
jgi:hypothetical protein